MFLSRRQFLASTAAGAALAALPASPLRRRAAFAAQPLSLTAESRVIEVQGKAAKVFGIRQADGKSGLIVRADEAAPFTLRNALSEETLLHWHGQTPPQAQDGVPGLSQAPLAAGQSFTYDFPLRPGTHWMHSHSGLQEQKLLAAPMVAIEDPRADVQDVVVLLHDFSFKDPRELLAGLTGGSAHGGHGANATSGHDMSSMGGHDMHAMMGHDMGMSGHSMEKAAMSHGASMAMSHLNDIDYDAYLANDRTLDDPEIVRVEPGGKVRLRIINGATATAFFIDTGALKGEVVAADGNPVRPLAGSLFPMAMGQRLDILVTLPKEQAAWPILALREGDAARTGIILATRQAAIAKLSPTGTAKAGAVDNGMEATLTAAAPLAARKTDRKLNLTLGGGTNGYVWTLNDATYGRHSPREVKAGERVELAFVNMSPMMHPMHLHGHHFQVVALDGKPVNGAMRDTVIVPANGGSVTVAFDAANPGEWVVHCHNLFHMATGMMTTIKYV